MSSFWHLTGSNDYLRWNASLGNGWTQSVSALAIDLPGVVTRYGHAHKDRQKEHFWESVRPAHRPSRIGVLYAFTDRHHAWRAQEEWGGDLPNRILIEVIPHPNAVVHIADARHLESTYDQWPEAARLYWDGHYTQDPRPEVLIHGAVYLPCWETSSFRQL